MRKIIFGIIIFFYISAYSQSENMTKRILEDYEYFCEIVKANPQIEVRKDLQNLHLLDTLEAYKLEIAKCKNYKEFAFLLDQISNMLNDAHFGVAFTEPSMSQQYVKANDKYHKYIWKKKRFAIVLPYLFYFDGRYFFEQSLVIGKQLVIPKKAELISIEGLSPKEYIRQTFKQSLRNKWDYSNNYFYRKVIKSRFEKESINFTIQTFDTLKNITIKKRGFLKIFQKFEISNANNVECVKSNIFRPITFVGGGFVYAKNPVLFLDEQKILYINIHSMFIEPKTIIDEIVKYKNKDIEKVVIDIRNNTGGSDLTWIEVLQHIIPKTLNHNIHYAYVDSKIINERIKKEFEVANIVKSDIYVDVPFLESNKYKLIIEKESITPAKNSIKFAGNIYILQDEDCFSASGSLLSLAENYENIINVGIPTGVMLGRGVTPFILTLPNSKLSIRINPVIDLTNVNSIQDIFHDKVKIPVSISLEEKLKFNKNSSSINKSFLLNNDPWMKAIFDYK